MLFTMCFDIILASLLFFLYYFFLVWTLTEMTKWLRFFLKHRIHATK
jgi:hypothetical protein